MQARMLLAPIVWMVHRKAGHSTGSLKTHRKPLVCLEGWQRMVSLIGRMPPVDRVMETPQKVGVVRCRLACLVTLAVMLPDGSNRPDAPEFPPQARTRVQEQPEIEPEAL